MTVTSLGRLNLQKKIDGSFHTEQPFIGKMSSLTFMVPEILNAVIFTGPPRVVPRVPPEALY